MPLPPLPPLKPVTLQPSKTLPPFALTSTVPESPAPAPRLYPVVWVQIPTGAWWPCWYLPQKLEMVSLHEQLFESRKQFRRNENNEASLQRDYRTLQTAMVMELYRGKASEPVWLMMGNLNAIRTYPFDEITNYLTVEDDDFVEKVSETLQQAERNQNAALQEAMKDYGDYRRYIVKTAPENAITVNLPARRSSRAVTEAATRPARITVARSRTDSGDAATVVTAASSVAPYDSHYEDDPVDEQDEDSETQAKNASKKKRGQKRSKTQKSKTTREASAKRPRGNSSTSNTSIEKDSETIVASACSSPAPPVEQTKVIADPKLQTPTSPQPDTPKDNRNASPSSVAKANPRALQEAHHGTTHHSPRSTKNLHRRCIEKEMESELPVLDNETNTKQRTDDAEPQTISAKVTNPADGAETDQRNDDNVAEMENDSSTDFPMESRETEHTVNSMPEPEPEAIVDVELPGTTNMEKLDSCLAALEKEKETIVTCRKIAYPKQRILTFLDDVVKSKGRVGPDDSSPGMHICGAPGSGKSLTVEACCKQIEAKFKEAAECEENPPRFCYVNCSVLQNFSKDNALKHTLSKFDLSEKSLKRSEANEDFQSAIIFILDEIDHLVSSDWDRVQPTRAEEYIKQMIDWATDERYLVALLGISNSVENGKVDRLTSLGFPRENKIAFRTYSVDDLKHIAMNKIGTSVVDEKSITLLAKNVASSSGDARKLVEGLSRAIAKAKETLKAEELNCAYSKPLITMRQMLSVIREYGLNFREKLDAIPIHQQKVLTVCLHLSQMLEGETNKTLSLNKLLSICRQAYGNEEFNDVGGVRSALQSLVDSISLQAKITVDEVVFGEQLEEVYSAVKEHILVKSYFRDAMKKLDSTI